jgi:hypothetical protein
MFTRENPLLCPGAISVVYEREAESAAELWVKYFIKPLHKNSCPSEACSDCNKEGAIDVH